MKKILTFIFAILFAIPCFADIGATNGVANSATCDSGALDTDSGGAALEAQYTPETINLKWYDEGGTRIATNSCTYDNGITLPSNPTRTGYTFKGWRAIPGTRIEYIESTGTQWIDTGIKFTGNLIKYELVFSTSESLHDMTLFGASDNNTNWSGLLWTWKNTTGLYAGKSELNLYNFAIETIYDNSITINKNNNTWSETINGIDYTGVFNGVPTSNVNIVLFGHNNGNSVYQKASYKNYSFKITQDGTLVRDMIPVKDSNGVPCMYDKVSGQFFYNQGTGNFIAGPEI